MRHANKGKERRNEETSGKPEERINKLTNPMR
jgi:hypothetical protein